MQVVLVDAKDPPRKAGGSNYHMNRANKLFARGNFAAAMLDDVNAPTVDRALVQMKIVDLPVDVAVDEPAADDAAISETVDPVD